MEIPKFNKSFNRIEDLIRLSSLPFIIKSAIEVGFFDVLADNNGLTLENIIEKRDTDPLLSKYLLEVLILFELVKKDQEYYSITEESKLYLTAKSSLNQLGVFEHLSASENNILAKNLSKALKKEPLQTSKQKMNWADEKVMTNMKQEVLGNSNLQDLIKFVNSFSEFQKATKMCDLAGNSGYYSLIFLQLNKSLNSHVYDVPEVCQTAKKMHNNDENFHRVVYHGKDLKSDFSFGNNYDFFFISHFLYSYVEIDELVKVLKTINKSLKMGGLFISNHFGNNLNNRANLLMSIINLRANLFGLKSHQIKKEVLKEALLLSGFDKIKICDKFSEQNSLHTMPLAAIKVKEV